jgi:hypothetical protein
MLKLSNLALSAVLVMIPVDVAQASVLNNSFETGDFTNWDTTGSTTVEDSSFGVTPNNGTYQAILHTCFYESQTQACDESQFISDFNQLELFLDFQASELSNLGVTEGSAIKQTITVDSGDILTFNWKFLTDNEPDQDYNDFAFFTIDNDLEILANTESNLLPNIPNSFSYLSKETGYQQASYKFTSTGSYLLGFGVVDIDLTGGGDTTVNSALLIDNLRLTTPTASTSESSTIIGLLILGGMAIASKKYPF